MPAYNAQHNQTHEIHLKSWKKSNCNQCPDCTTNVRCERRRTAAKCNQQIKTVEVPPEGSILQVHVVTQASKI